MTAEYGCLLMVFCFQAWPVFQLAMILFLENIRFWGKEKGVNIYETIEFSFSF
jgi:hypothetical protein